jgi:hypothetical protein
VNVSETRQKVFQERPFRSAELFVSHFEESFNPDTGEVTFVDIFGFTELMSDEFDVDRKLQSGFVMADLILQGFSCTEGPHEPNGNGFEFETECTEIGPEVAAVDVVWDGNGPVFHSRFTDRFSSDGIRVSFTSTSTSRDATVAGSVQGDTIAFDLDGASGNLSRDSNSEMVVSRGGMFFF